MRRDLLIAKHRNGALGDVPLVFQDEYPRFLDHAAGEPDDAHVPVRGAATAAASSIDEATRARAAVPLPRASGVATRRAPAACRAVIPKQVQAACRSTARR